MKPPKSFERLLCRCNHGRITTDGRCTKCKKPTQVSDLTEEQIFRVVRRLEKKADRQVVVVGHTHP